MSRRWAALGAGLFVAALGVGAARLEAALGPAGAPGAAADLAAAEAALSGGEPAAATLAAADPAVALLLSLPPRPTPVQRALVVGSMPEVLARALQARTGQGAAAVARALSVSADGSTAQAAALDAWASTLDAEDEGLARAAATTACRAPGLARGVASRARPDARRGAALALTLTACGLAPPAAEAHLLEVLSAGGDLAPVAALELGRLGRPGALPALRAAAAAHPDDLLGLCAAYSAAALERTAATATQPPGPR